MEYSHDKQYYYLLKFFILFYLSSTTGEKVDPSGNKSLQNETQRHLVSSLMLADSYVPIILSKPATAEGSTVLKTVESSFRNIETGSNNIDDILSNNSKNASETNAPSLERKLVTKSKSAGLSQKSSSSFNVLDIVGNLDARFKHIRNIELGVTYAQEIFDAMGISKAHTTEETIVNLASKIQSKLEIVHDALNNLSEFIGSNITLSVKKNGTRSDAKIFLNTLIQPCPFDDFTLEQNYNKKQIQVLNYLKTSGFTIEDNLSFTINNQMVKALRKMTNVASHPANIESTTTASLLPESTLNGSTTFKSSQQQSATFTSNFKHVFLLSRSDHASDHNCQYYFNDINFRHIYASAICNKHVFLVIDSGNSLSIEQLELSKQFVSNIVQMLSDDDTITIVMIDSRAQPLRLTQSSDGNTIEENLRYNGTMDRKQEILMQISNLTPSKETTNHSLAFEYSFQLLKQQNIAEAIPLIFVYVTRGLLNRFTEAKSVLTTAANGQSLLRKPIVINTCAVILDEKRIMYEKQFLHDIAHQNYSKYDINVSSWLNPKDNAIQGNMYVITKRHPELIIKTSTAVFERIFKPEYVSTDIKYHLPVLDYNTKDIIVSITKAIPRYGVAGINMYLDDLAEDIIYYHKADDFYSFLIDLKGKVIFHPAFSRPVATSNYAKPPYPVDITLLEPELLKIGPTNQSIWEIVLNSHMGNITVNRSTNNGEDHIFYIWRRILDAYIVFLAATERVNKQFDQHWKIHTSAGLSKTNIDADQFERYEHHFEIAPSSELLYHRIDLIPPPKTPVCRHFRQIATLDTGTIFLSASAFKSPFIYFKNNREGKDETQRAHNAQSIMAYIKDITNLLANPGLQMGIRSDVSALLHVMKYLKKRHMENSPLKTYIIRRYVATKNGVLQVYPGCILGSGLEPTRRPWFRKAVRHSGRTVITEPYLDAGGAGYVVTIAHAIFEGKANALHNADRDTPIAVVALDVPYAFFYKLLLESSPLCSETKIKCLIMEDEGFLVAHPSMMEPSTPSMNNRRPLEHITHKESFVANDILNHNILVKKRACASFQSRITHRYYEFNTSLTQVLMNNVVHGERTKYQITAIPGTNTFAAVLNSTCDGGAFCPCSTVDRICLNCNRMDQAECECPCECPLKMTTASVDNASRSSTLSFCEPDQEGLSVVNSLSYDWNLVVKPCVNINCELYTTHFDCLGVMGCEWCQLDVDMNPFPTPFCAAQSSCFNGFLGSTTPYGDADLGSAIIEPITAPAYSAVGPVGGTIVALCLMVGFAMYCYRQNLENGSEDLCGTDSMQDDYGLPLSRMYFDDITSHDDNDPNGNGGLGGANIMHRGLLHPLANAIAVNEMSPYHMSAGGYRRPANGESDHGYSTMTPHEDSEHMCFTLAEPLIANQNRLSMSADSLSINTSVSSPTNHSYPLAYLQTQQIPIDRPSMPNSPVPSFQNTISSNTSSTTIVPKLHSNLMIKGESEMLSSSVSPISGQTIIPNDGHHILAPVTVHRHMEAS